MESAQARVTAPPARVLIVDDEPLFLELVEVMLESEGDLELVGKARNGKEAVKLASTLDPDLIVMDISMPVMDGINATREIRARDPGASILILTGGTSIAEIDQARKAGAAGYLTKDRIASDLLVEIRGLAAK